MLSNTTILTSLYKPLISGHICRIFVWFYIFLSFLFGERIDCGKVVNNKIDEASGIASSMNNKDLLWTHNDSGDLARVYAIGLDGSHRGVLRLSGTIPRDWEDMCIGPGPEHGFDYIYLADIGDNFSNRNKKIIHRIKEPIIESDSLLAPFDIKTKDFETIVFKYPDGNRDAEALMIDPLTKDIFILSKRESSVHLYRLAYPQSVSSVIMAEKVGSLTISPERRYYRSDQVTSADISRDGEKILIKTYYNVILIEKPKEDPMSSILSSKQRNLYYIREIGGEAVCWRWDQEGYYTISEEVKDRPAHLYYYPFKFSN